MRFQVVNLEQVYARRKIAYYEYDIALIISSMFDWH